MSDNENLRNQRETTITTILNINKALMVAWNNWTRPEEAGGLSVFGCK